MNLNADTAFEAREKLKSSRNNNLPLDYNENNMNAVNRLSDHVVELPLSRKEDSSRSRSKLRRVFRRAAYPTKVNVRRRGDPIRLTQRKMLRQSQLNRSNNESSEQTPHDVEYSDLEFTPSEYTGHQGDIDMTELIGKLLL